MKFSEALKGFSQWKQENKGTSAITKEELAAVRKAYKEGKFNNKPAMRESSKNSSFKDVVRKYSAFKEAKTGNGVVTVREAKALKEGLAKKNTATKEPAIIKQFSEWKLKKYGTSTVTLQERKELMAAANKKHMNESKKDPALNAMVKKYSAWKQSKGLDGKVTMKEAQEIKAHMTKMTEAKKDPMTAEKVMSKVREARRLSYKAKKLLREGDMMGAQDMATGAMDAAAGADAGMGAMDAAQEPVPQNVVDAVSAIKASVDDLATQCGIEPAMDPGADPQAGVPGMTGVADPNAMGDPTMGAQPQMMESTAAIRRRLNARAAKINGIKENVKPEFANPLGDIGGQNVQPEKRTVNTKNDEYQLGEVPSAAAIAKGSAKDAVKWPTKPIKNAPKSLVESMVDKKIKEDEDRWDFAKILQSGVLG